MPVEAAMPAGAKDTVAIIKAAIQYLAAFLHTNQYLRGTILIMTPVQQDTKAIDTDAVLHGFLMSERFFQHAEYDYLYQKLLSHRISVVTAPCRGLTRYCDRARPG
ncbi:MAG TPA: hypothetical protein ENK49_04140 [Gammaproteobacteria bacterium]|nr:hypothetical protein [Gammaproteobacteria bacterium]